MSGTPSPPESPGSRARQEVHLDPTVDNLTAPVVVACSGGADSLGLLLLAHAAGLEPTAVHVDHGLRADSADDAEVVAHAADRLGVPWQTVRVQVVPGGNLEARARDARYRALASASEQLGARAILVAHTADDQAETVLINVMRGSGTAGLAGMARRQGNVVRPLLHMRRADVRAMVERAGLPIAEDPTNDDRRWRRAWIRHDVLPMLERGAQRDLVPVLVRQAEIFRAESDFLDGLGDDLIERAVDPGQDSALVARVVADAPLPIARRAIRRWLGPPPPSADEVERVLAVVRGECVRTQLAGSMTVQRSSGRISIVASKEVP